MCPMITADPLVRSSWAELSSEFRRQHFLVGLCLTNLHNAVSQDNGDVHSKAVSLVRNLLTSHDTDPRCSNTRALNEPSRSCTVPRGSTYQRLYN